MKINWEVRGWTQGHKQCFVVLLFSCQCPVAVFSGSSPPMLVKKVTGSYNLISSWLKIQKERRSFFCSIHIPKCKEDSNWPESCTFQIQSVCGRRSPLIGQPESHDLLLVGEGKRRTPKQTASLRLGGIFKAWFLQEELGTY